MSLVGTAAGRRLPDLVVRWRPTPAMAIDAVVRAFGTVERAGAGSGRTGNHTEGDAWAVLAPGASRHREPPRPARMVDWRQRWRRCAAAAMAFAGEPLLEP